MSVNLPYSMGEALPHHVELGSLHRIQVLRLLLDLLAGELGVGRPQFDHRLRELGDAVLVGGHPGSELRCQRIPQTVFPASEIGTASAELTAGRAEFGGL